MRLSKDFFYFFSSLAAVFLLGIWRVAGSVRALEIFCFAVLGLSFLSYGRWKISHFQAVGLLIITWLLIRASILGNASELMFGLRSVSCVVCFVVFYMLSAFLTLRSSYLYCVILLLLCFYYFKIYNYFWEFTYIFSVVAALALNRQKDFMFFGAAALVFLPAQRTALFNVFYLLVRRFRMRRTRGAALVAVLVGVGVVVPSSINIDESRVFSTVTNFDAKIYKDSIVIGSSMAGDYTYDEFVYGQRYSIVEGGDLSFQLRLRKWLHAYSQLNPMSFFFGLGPGYFGKAADSGWVRLLCENGVIFFGLVLVVLRSFWVSSTGRQRNVLLIFCITNLFLDIMYSPMLVAFTGLCLGVERKDQDGP